MRPRLAPRRTRETPAACLARTLGITQAEAERRLLASRKAGWRMQASPEEIEAEEAWLASVKGK